MREHRQQEHREQHDRDHEVRLLAPVEVGRELEPGTLDGVPVQTDPAGCPRASAGPSHGWARLRRAARGVVTASWRRPIVQSTATPTVACQHGRHEVWTRLRLLVAAATLARDDRLRSGRATSRTRRRRAARPTRSTRRPRDGHGSHGTLRRAGARPGHSATGERRRDARDARALHAVGTHRLRHRRLPLLPARPEARPGRLAHRHQRAARQPRRRAPRHPVPGPAAPGGSRPRQLDEESPGEGWTCFGGTGLDAFQGIDDAPWLGAWAPGGAESVHQRRVRRHARRRARRS